MQQPTIEPNPYGESKQTSVAPAPTSRPEAELAAVAAALRKARFWVSTLSVTAMLLAGLVLLSAVGNLRILSMTTGTAGFRANVWPFLRIIAGYGVCAAGLAIPALLLARYGIRIGRFLRRREIRELESALIAQRSFWCWTCVITIVLFVGYVAWYSFVVYSVIADYNSTP